LPPIGRTGETAERRQSPRSFVINESWEHRKLAARRKLHIGATIAVLALTLVLCVGIGLLYIGWQPGSSLSITGYIAMALGLLAAIMLCVGLVWLIHCDRHRGE
jgi:sterol desaturase/sphingolipid hydroxylase (fatty acid hydroxylase superfamily)